MSELSVDVTSVPDRDRLVAELWSGSEQIAELSIEDGCLMLRIYPPTSGVLNVELDEFERGLAELRRRLTSP